ncbi:MAG: hypothetical protein Q8K97_04560 [Pseudohongiella sp.]|nr:hypothetical protein [Pseudohongiella sp.]
MTLQQELALRAAHVDEKELLRLMGYSRPTQRHCQRLRAVLADPMLGLSVSAFDFRFGNRAFIQALGQVLGINRADVREGLRLICQKIETEAQRFKPVIQVDTGFKRTTQPIFALAACEHHRYVLFSPQELDHYYALPVAERVRLVSEKVRQHYQQCQGFLGIWGYIQRYIYQYEDALSLVLLPDGTIIEETSQTGDNIGVSLQHKGKPLNALISASEQ